MIVLAIDSGLEKTGYSVFHNKGIDSYLRTSGLLKTDKTIAIEKRLLQIYQKLNKVINEFRPQVIVIEQLFFFKNKKTAIAVSQTQGVIMLLAAQHKIALKLLTPLQIKKTVTGYGQADKLSIRKMVNITLHISKKIKEDDEIDAIACGLAYCYLNKSILY
ncbi:crossover junction endodeoxyribonuclease RuvC [Candidatus Roizmanbacteria bacterium RIFCSPHIGHO2_01_FULL_39_12c]|uniref:Crossover junction endodeoxyribonuclease RuvC n=1 Tax=Candidatus Roizmanbacteria bacterium RIFCSPHIGHO2_01_FULL_39_12c TaxID=1802031 RepID=A0A1F7G867_9BACT|nr:MAG: crossover junction endodeoxyribonuclease RuvC [Candidatus Roizmanbacteria bacterium RIFCSPHIGHO2_01_FULL_39_12c]OGK46278.1 MAG: crossover junction endodeoxyribonuclease RuvC [Candidatus Roizmanbacteria bacterium RIFCSPLOWO2_01_FULL_40_13]